MKVSISTVFCLVQNYSVLDTTLVIQTSFSSHLEKKMLTSTKKEEELGVMLAIAAANISLEEISGDGDFFNENSGNADETIRTVRMVSTSKDYPAKIDKIVELNAELEERDQIIKELRNQIATLEEKTCKCVCKKKRDRENSFERSFRGKSKLTKTSVSSTTRERSFLKQRKTLSPIQEEKTGSKPKLQWKPKNKV